jgi:hypothetical protein
MPYFGVPIRNGLPIGLGSQAGFGIAPFDPRDLFSAGEQGAWYDSSDFSTLFTDSAGTTPVTAVEQFVGLMLDKSKGLVLGPELVTNGDFGVNLTGWTIDTGASAVRDTTIFPSGGMLVTANGAINSYARQTITGLTVGRTYKITTQAYSPNTNAANNRATIGTQNSGFTTSGSVAQQALNTVQTLSIVFVATGTSQTIYCSVVTADFASWGTNGSQGYFDNISVRELPGNHATSTGTKRPKLAARYNLLTYTEQFDNGAWTKTNATAANTTATTDPLGGTTADTLLETAANGAHFCVQSVTTVAASYAYAIYIKANGRTRIAIAGSSVLGGNLGNGVFFDIGTGQYISGATGTPSITDAGNGWWLVKYTWTASAATGNLGVYLVDTGTNTSYAGDPTKGVYLWGADLRPASQATGLIGPTYQRVVDAATYDTAGFLPYLQFDGIDDSMSTGSIDATAVDKAQVFAGVRKQANNGVVYEFSTAFGSNNRSFVNFAGDYATATGSFWMVGARGDAVVNANQCVENAQTSPVTNVLTALHDISGNLTSFRKNAVFVADATGDKGAGNFGNYPLFIGARNNSSLYFNGWLSSMIVRFGATLSQSQIEATESWVNSRTGAY